MRVLNLPVPVADAGVDFDIARRDRATVGSAPATEPPPRSLFRKSDRRPAAAIHSA